MQKIAQQLEQVRRKGRALLVAQRLAQAAAWAAVALIALGVIDFGLRLPGWMRALVGVGLLITGLVWLGRRLSAAWTFWPTLSELALRVERLYPRLSGVLTSALDFALHPQKYEQPAATAAMAGRSVALAEKELAGVQVARLIDLKPTRRRAGWLLGAAVLLGLVVGMMPTYSAIAASRWLMPWGDTAWPKRTQLEPTPTAAVRPVDSPIEFTTQVTHGFRPGMRVWLNTRWVDAEGNADGLSQAVLMTEQLAINAAPTGSSPGSVPGNISDTNGVAGSDGDSGKNSGGGGVFKLQWRAPADIVRQITSGESAGRQLEVWFEAGDDRTESQRVELVARPQLTELTAELSPPGYAVGLSSTQTLALHERTDRVVSLPTLEGSRVRLTLGINKSLPAAMLEPAALVPGLAGYGGVSLSRVAADRVVIEFTLAQSIETPIVLTDKHGLTNTDERTYRLERVEDRRPMVTILQPSADTSVLATAVLLVEARADDDVGVRRLWIDADHPARVEPGSEATRSTTPLAERGARQAELSAQTSLDLSTMALLPGDVVTLGAHTQDVYELNGFRHDPVDATPRQLRIIDAATLIAQVRADLAGVRQQAVRLEHQQGELNRRQQAAPATRAAEQQRITRGLETQARQLQNVRGRLDLNRLDEPALDALIAQATELVDDAQQDSNAAQAKLNEAAAAEAKAAQAAAESEGPAESEAAQKSTEAQAQAAESQAAQDQEAVRQQLDELAKLLDQGQDALGLKLELARLQTEQAALAQDTRELLPRTAGRAADDLPQELRERLEELRERQDSLGQQARETVERLQDTAEALARQSAQPQNGEPPETSPEQSDRDRATAQALAEAAAVAQRQGLSQQMEASEEGLDENRLSQAGEAQLDALDTLEQMMEKLGDQDELRQELLRRRLLALAEKLKRLIEGQTLAIASLENAADEQLGGLAEVQSALWVRTIAVQTEAEADENTAEVAPIVGQAVAAQAQALPALRGGDRAEALAGKTVALERLEEALAKVQEKQAEAEEDKTEQEREKLREAYLELAARQAVLIDEVAPLLDAPALTRRTRAALRGLGQTQGEIKDAAKELGDKVSEAVVFRRMHGLIDRTAERARAPLSRGEDDGWVIPSQRKVALLLESLAAALDDSKSDQPQEFAEDSQSGGGGGGGGQPPPLVPPAAELKLLRSVQIAVYEETRALGETVRGRPTPGQATRLDDLAAEQRELSDAGRRLIESMSQQASPSVMPITPPDAPDAPETPDASNTRETPEAPEGKVTDE